MFRMRSWRSQPGLPAATGETGLLLTQFEAAEGKRSLSAEGESVRDRFRF